MKTIVNYAQKVKEQHALNKTLAPVETDLTDASRSYAIGEQFINDGDLFRAKTPIAQHDALVLNTNYEAADDITTQIKNKTVTTDSVPTEGSTNPVQSNGVFVENRNIYAVMGEMGAKNLLPFDLDEIKAANTEGTWAGNVYTRRNVSFTVNSDYSVDVVADGITNTQASGFFYYSASGAEKFVGKSVTLTGCPISGGSSTYNLQAYRAASVDGSGGTEKDTGSGVTLDWMNNGTGIKAMVAISIGAEVSCNAKFKPMLRYAEDIDSTYQPYAKTNQQLTVENEALTNQVTDISDEVTDMNNVLGAKNLLPNNVESRTLNGVTFTVNNDGSITINGTATNTTFFYLVGDSNTESGYKLSGSFIVSTQNYISQDSYLRIGKTAGDYTNVREETVVSFSENSDIYVVIRIASGEVIDNVTLYPMIRLASIEDSTYVPYAKTNQELTAENQTLANQADDIVDVLSAKNIWSETIPPTANSGGSYTLANHEYVVSTTASTNSGVYWPTDKLSPFYADMVGVRAKLSFEVKADAPMRAYAGFYNNEVSLTTDYQKIEQDIADLSQIASAFKVYTLDTTSAHTISMKNVMIRPASITSDTFVPYAMTNRELTENYNIKTAFVSVPATYHGGSVANINFEKRNGVVHAWWAGGTPTFPAQGTEYEIGDIPEGFIPSQAQTGYGIDMNSFTKGMYLQLRTNGKIYIFGYNTGTGSTVNALVSLVYFV